MEQKPRNSWSNISFGVIMVLFGLSFCLCGLGALSLDTTVPGNFKRPPISGAEAMTAGSVFYLAGCIWLWTCFRRKNSYASHAAYKIVEFV